MFNPHLIDHTHGDCPRRTAEAWCKNCDIAILKENFPSAIKRPYCDKPYDRQHIQEICSGLRPKVVSGTPPVFVELMLRCLDAKLIKFANSAELERSYFNISLSHKKAIYSSRPLDSINIESTT